MRFQGSFTKSIDNLSGDPQITSQGTRTRLWSVSYKDSGSLADVKTTIRNGGDSSDIFVEFTVPDSGSTTINFGRLGILFTNGLYSSNDSVAIGATRTTFTYTIEK